VEFLVLPEEEVNILLDIGSVPFCNTARVPCGTPEGNAKKKSEAHVQWVVNFSTLILLILRLK
jgi:hypothetical protein